MIVNSKIKNYFVQRDGRGAGFLSLKKTKFGDWIYFFFQKHNRDPQMQPRLPDLVIMHHMCIQSMHTYEKHRDAERKGERGKSERGSSGD